MSALYITDRIAVTPRPAPLLDNGLTGDARVALRLGDAADGSGEVHPYLETNGGPRLIESEPRDHSCTIAEAARALGESPADLIETVRQELPAIDW